MPSKRVFGFKNINFERFSPDPKVPKINFWKEAFKVAV
jgi:hypothetical protein